jgi:hypothetical protein
MYPRNPEALHRLVPLEHDHRVEQTDGASSATTERER